MNNKKRSLARYIAVQAVYQINEAKISYEKIIEEFTDFHSDKITLDFKDSFKEKNLKPDFSHFKKIINNHFLKNEIILCLIKKNLSDNWKIHRLPKVLRAILEVSVSEILTFPNLTIGIITSEYVILTEAFFSKDESSFANAIIESVYKNIKKDELVK